MIMKLSMKHYVLKVYKIYINDDPELTLPYFTTMSNLAKLVRTYSRPRYQVNVYRTILVLWFHFLSFNIQCLFNYFYCFSGLRKS